MPLDTRDRDPYWSVGARPTSRQLEQARNQGDRLLWGPLETQRSANPVARWSESKVGRNGYGLFSTAPDARGRLQGQLPDVFRGRLGPKCNQFVFDALQAGGAPAGRMDGGRIPVAKDWGKPSSKIPGYSPIVDQPRPGDVVSNGKHVGIFSPLPGGRPGTVSAATLDSASGRPLGRVVHNDWGFRGDEGAMTVWRPTGAARRP